MRKITTAILLLVLTYANAQKTKDLFSIVALQGKDTLQIGEGLKNYDAIRISWINKSPVNLKAIEVHFGNGEMPFAKRDYKVGKSQKLVLVDLQEFLALDTRDIESPRKREAEFSRIVIVCVMDDTSYKTYVIPFKVPER